MKSSGVGSGEGGGSGLTEPRIELGVDIGLDGGEALRRKFVRSDAKKASRKSHR